MNSKYKTVKYKKNKSSNIEDLVSIEEPLEMVVRYKKDNDWVDNSISITMRTPKNVLLGHLLCALIGILFVTLFKISQDRTIFFLAIGLAVGLSVMLMMALKITHPPAGGNTIVVMLAQDSFQFLIFPIMVGAVTIIIGGIIYNRFILKKKYPLKWFKQDF